ncbi:MAG TPA: DNA methyltransferase [Pyrinomonadaceae bacterium]|nr:DNA methyltransferase [Pyrinomonadaceae bacterium]
MSYYSKINPIESSIAADRQGAKRHYGVHPYFTRRPYNVVRDYILRYSQERDRVLDPFGGSGVTAIEAFLENRIGMHNDINPLANFIATGIAGLQNGTLADYEDALTYVEGECRYALSRIHEYSDHQLEALKESIRLPEDIALPRTADVKQYRDLFSLQHLLSLAILKQAIDAIVNEPIRQGMLLAWSATLAKLNKTFLSAEGRAESRGGSSIFSIYRYKVAKEPIELPAWDTFSERVTNVIRAKIEIDQAIQMKRQTGGWRGGFEAYSRDVEDLSLEFPNSIDYIFTDPPYGGHISYLDLSTLWNSWLGLSPSKTIREKELIVGGELQFTEETYIERLGKSIRGCVKMLKKDRWFSIVFQHWNPSYFEAILSSAAESGAELKAAVSQIGDPIWSMHKKKNNSVLAGEMILTFHNTGRLKKARRNGHFNVQEAVNRILDNTHDNHVFGEYIFNRIIIEAWNNAAIHSLDMSKEDFIDLLRQSGWHYDQQKHYWAKDKPQLELLMTSG